MNPVNVEIFKIINGYAGKSVIIDTTMILIAKACIFFIPIYLIWMFSKSNAYYKHQALFSLYCGTLGLLLNYFAGLIYFNPRPFALNIGTALIHHSRDNSFPSDHTTLVVAVGLYLASERPLRKQGITVTLMGILIGIARIFCGVHWPIDILGSIVVAVVACLAIRSTKTIFNKPNQLIIAISNKVYKKFLGQ